MDAAGLLNRHCRFHLIPNPLNSAVSVFIAYACIGLCSVFFIILVVSVRGFGPGASVWLVVAAISAYTRCYASQ